MYMAPRRDHSRGVGESCDRQVTRPTLCIQQRRGHGREIVAAHRDVAVRDQQHRVAGHGQHVDEVAALVVVAVALRIHDDIDRQIGKFLGQARDDGQRRIGRIERAEDDLELRDTPAGRRSADARTARARRRTAASEPSPAAAPSAMCRGRDDIARQASTATSATSE